MTQTSDAVRLAARAATTAGIVVLPARPDGYKQPIGSWREYQHRRPTVEEFRDWFIAHAQDGMGFICGEVSGGLEMLEFEDEHTHAAFVAFAHDSGLGDIADRIASGYEEHTPGGGTHWFYRIPGAVRGNTKLASKPCPGDPTCTKHVAGKPHVLVETRGEGGWVVVAPSAGQTHDSGRPYEMVSGGPGAIATLTEEERDELWALARTFDKMPLREAIPDRAPPANAPTGGRPGDVFNARAAWADVLTPHGWTFLFTHGDLSYWRRPGKQRGVSATAGKRNPGDPTSDLLWVFTTSTEFEAEAGYSKWRAFALLNHGGDHRAAASALRGLGYAAPPQMPPARPGPPYAPAGAVHVDPTTGEIVTSPPEGEPDRYAHSLIDWATFWLADHQDEDWLVEPILPRHRSIAMYSPAKAGKSLLTLDVAARLATGQRVLDSRPAAPLNVMYLDLEMTEGDLYERLSEMGYGPEADLSHLFYYLLPSLPPLDTEAGGTAVRDLARKHEADLVIIDTTSRVLSGGENDSDTLRAFYMHTGLPLKADGRTVWRLDHAGKALERGQRGTSAKNDDVDLVWELMAGDLGTVNLRATHRRQSWVPEHVNLTRIEGPLRHERAIEAWQPGTNEYADHLDRLDAPLEIATRKAAAMLREHGVKVRNAVVADAVKYRRMRAESDPQTSGITQPRASGIAGGDHRGSLGGSLGDHSGSRSPAIGDHAPPLRGGSDPGPSGRHNGTAPNACVDCGVVLPGGRVRCEDCVRRKQADEFDQEIRGGM